jgi:hypothetical protein
MQFYRIQQNPQIKRGGEGLPQIIRGGSQSGLAKIQALLARKFKNFLETRINRKKYVSSSLGGTSEKTSPISIHICHQIPNTARETVPFSVPSDRSEFFFFIFGNSLFI